MIQPLAKRFERLESAREEVDAELARFNAAQRAFRPGPDSWSVAEVLDHVVRVERSVLEGARKAGVNRFTWKDKPVRRFLTWLLLRAGVRIKVPQRVRHVTPERDSDLDDVLRRWFTVRHEWREFLDSVQPEQLSQLAIKHPIAGPFSYRDVLAFLEWHLRHHRQQIERIQHARGFPRLQA